MTDFMLYRSIFFKIDFKYELIWQSECTELNIMKIRLLLYNCNLYAMECIVENQICIVHLCLYHWKFGRVIQKYFPCSSIHPVLLACLHPTFLHIHLKQHQNGLDIKKQTHVCDFAISLDLEIPFDYFIGWGHWIWLNRYLIINTIT